MPYLFEIILMLGAIAMALKRGAAVSAPIPLSPPNVWVLRILGGIGIALLILSPGIFKGTNVPFPIALIISAVIYFAAIRRIAAWSQRSGWNERHRLALASWGARFFSSRMGSNSRSRRSSGRQTDEGHLPGSVGLSDFSYCPDATNQSCPSSIDKPSGLNRTVSKFVIVFVRA